MLSSTAQLDYNIAGFTFDGIAFPAAVLHLQSATFNDAGNAIINIQIFASAASMGVNTPLTTGQWAYPVADGQTMAQVWQSLSTAGETFTTLDGTTISFADASPIGGE